MLGSIVCWLLGSIVGGLLMKKDREGGDWLVGELNS